LLLTGNTEHFWAQPKMRRGGDKTNGEQTDGSLPLEAWMYERGGIGQPFCFSWHHQMPLSLRWWQMVRKQDGGAYGFAPSMYPHY